MRVTTFCYNSFDEKTKIMKGAVTLMSIVTLLDALVEELNLAEEKFFNVPNTPCILTLRMLLSIYKKVLPIDG